MKIHHVLAALSIGVLAGTTQAKPAMTSVEHVETVGPAKWRVEVRQIKASDSRARLNATSGHILGTLDLTQNGNSGHMGESISYLDGRTIHIDQGNGSGGSAETMVLRTGLAVSIEGQSGSPMIHVEDTKLVSFDEVLSNGVLTSVPKTENLAMYMPFAVVNDAIVAGVYPAEEGNSAVKRFFVVRRI